MQPRSHPPRYTVHQLATLANISIRTLHYYDEIDLLKPSFTDVNGYRYYEQKELIKLQQILFFRELDFSLGQMKQMFDSPGFDPIIALGDQKKLLAMKRDRLNNLLCTINHTITSMKKTKTMKVRDLYGSFTKKEMEQYKKEARRRWGHTEAYKQSMERTKNWTKKDYDRVKKENEEIIHALIAAMPHGVGSKEVQKVVAQHHQSMNRFYDCSYEIYKNLGKMYVEDARFTAYYDQYRPGLAEFLHKAIDYYCDFYKSDRLC